ncbi:unnamed protein product [Prunus armeniaca]
MMNEKVRVEILNYLTSLIESGCVNSGSGIEEKSRVMVKVEALPIVGMMMTECAQAGVMGLAGLNYASATLNTAMLNLIPAFTFILALLFRRLNI